MLKILMVPALVMAFVATPAMAQDADKARKMALAQEYSSVVPLKQEVEHTIEQLALQVPVDQRVLFKSILAKHIKVDRLKTASEMALVENFTAAELKAWVDFLKTPEGQSVTKKMPIYQEQVQPVLQQMVQEAIVSMQAQMQK